MKKIYYLKTCDTCKRILKTIPDINSFELIDIKEQPLEVSDIEQLYQRTNSYEVLFSKRAKLYKEIGLKDIELTEKDFRYYILEHYTFLSRPVIVIDDEIFVGNSPKNLKKLEQFFKNE